MKNQASIDIQRPITDVFILATDHIAQWSGFVAESRPTNIAEDGGVGTTFLYSVRKPNRQATLEMEAEIIEYTPPTRSTFVMRSRFHEIEVALDFESLSEDRTRVTQYWNWRTKGVWHLLLGLLETFIGKHLDRLQAAELDRLRVHCESGAPATPGGS